MAQVWDRRRQLQAAVQLSPPRRRHAVTKEVYSSPRIYRGQLVTVPSRQGSRLPSLSEYQGSSVTVVGGEYAVGDKGDIKLHVKDMLLNKMAGCVDPAGDAAATAEDSGSSGEEMLDVAGTCDRGTRRNVLHWLQTSIASPSALQHGSSPGALLLPGLKSTVSQAAITLPLSHALLECHNK